MNLDLKWNLILTIIFELESDDKTKVFISFIEFIVYLVTKNIRKTVSLDLTEKEKDNITNHLVEAVFEFISLEYSCDVFTNRNLESLKIIVEDTVRSLESDIGEKDIELFKERLKKEIEV